VLPPKDRLKICFAHAAYSAAGALRPSTNRPSTAPRSRTPCEIEQRIGDADVVVVSGLWRNTLLDRTPRLRFIQAVGAGTDQFDRDALRARGIRLASARGVNARAVAEHAMALILALTRKLPEARDNQSRRVWRGMISSIEDREDELGGKTLLIIGLGAIGSRLAALAKAFDLRVIGVKRDPSTEAKVRIRRMASRAHEFCFRQADFVALTCPLNKETEGIIDGEALSRMKRSACLVNVARGGCVDEPALVARLRDRAIAGAAIDVTAEEPLPSASPLWDLGNALITPHTAGETQKYEDRVLDILVDNLNRLWRGESALRNEIV
jgi:phosphoglycerate dehydrogenase-like enzyme